MVRRCWVNFQCRGVLLIWITVWQGPTALAVGAGGGYLDIFSLVCHFSFLSPSLLETARYILKYCLKGPLSPKQPTNQPNSGPFFSCTIRYFRDIYCICACRSADKVSSKEKPRFLVVYLRRLRKLSLAIQISRHQPNNLPSYAS